MIDQDWNAAAKEISCGWRVRKYSTRSGEMVGKVVSQPELSEDEVLRVLVDWEIGTKLIKETLLEPTWSRSLRRSDSSVVIGSTHSLTVFESNADADG